MKNLWKNEVEYIGVELTPKEASLISKILGNLSFNDREKFLSGEEEELYSELCAGFSA